MSWAWKKFYNLGAWARGYKTFFMLNSFEHEILNAHKYIQILLINVKMPIVVGILTFISRKKFMLSWAEHEKSFITLGPDLDLQFGQT